jgi:hypothetical protein
LVAAVRIQTVKLQSPCGKLGKYVDTLINVDSHPSTLRDMLIHESILTTYFSGAYHGGVEVR